MRDADASIATTSPGVMRVPHPMRDKQRARSCAGTAQRRRPSMVGWREVGASGARRPASALLP